MGMEKNITQQRFALIEKLLNEVNTKEEFIYLQKENKCLQYSIQMKGGARF